MCDDSNKPFEELVQLFQDDPEAFEQYRKQRLEEEIIKMCDGCPEKEDRCRAFVWRMEQELSKYTDPIARYNKMVEMFWKQVEEFKNATQLLENPPEDIQDADILQFPKKD